ncbi:MAG: PEP-CTERM sorting domain-containing protein [Phycisphaerales bacterium]|nr:PEP-CTERM sorting domain-containing protein [Phycisphaerales bacterium]
MKKALALALVAGLGTVAAAQPTTVYDFGAVNGMASYSGSHTATGQVIWFSLVLSSGATYLDITSNGSAFDTEIGLYRADGTLVVSDDDNGIGLQSTLTFGTGTGLLLGDTFNLGGNGLAEGENGPMPGAGTYYLALSRYNTTFNPTGFSVTSTGSAGGAYTITVYSNVPAPASLALLGLGAMVVRRRR